MTIDLHKVWLFLKAIFINPPWHGTMHQVFHVNAYMKIFTATMTLVVALTILYEMREAPRFIKTIIFGIVAVAVSTIVV